MIPDYLAFVEPEDTDMSGPFKEMINSARAYAYAANAGIRWLGDCGCDGAHPAATYTTPAAGAPWYDAADANTVKFLGVIGLDVTGADNSTRVVRVTPTLSTGGVIGPAYYGPRTLVVRALAIAVDEAGLQAGIDWLQFSFADDIDPCTADSLVFFDYCTDPVDGVLPASVMRQFRGARITEGPEILTMHRTMNSSVGACAEIELTYVTADPAEYRAKLMAVFSCGRHTAEIRTRGGTTVVGAAEPLMSVRYNRVRDDVSNAEIHLPTYECCELLADVRTIKHELHISRDGVPVWQGPITRLEYESDVVRVYAEDILWVMRRSTIEEGYNHAYPNIGNVIDNMDWIATRQTYLKNYDPWRMTGFYGGSNHLHPMHHADHDDDPRDARVVFPYSVTCWEDFDKFAEDYGADYTVVNRELYYWDNHLAWKVIPDLEEEYISEFPRIVEYGNQLITRAIVTNGKGYAGMSTAHSTVLAEYGYVDHLTSNVTESSILEGPPPPEDVREWAQTARRTLDGAYPPPVAIVIPANTTLLPGSPWTIDDLFPGAWFQISVERLCREVTEWQRLHEIVFEEVAPQGETVRFTAITAPGTMVIP